MHPLGQAADIVVRFDRHRRPAGERDALDHIRVERALRQKFGQAFSRICDFFRFRLEYVDEQFPDRLAFLFRVLDAGERLEEQLLGDNMHERNIVSAAEQGDHAFAFAEPQQAVIDEHAGELVADRFVDEHGGDGGIDAAGKTANHPALADLTADFLDRLVLERPHRPIAGTAGDIAHEVADERRAVRRVHDFEVELRSVEFALLIGDHRDRGVGGSPGRGKALPAAW